MINILCHSPRPAFGLLDGRNSHVEIGHARVEPRDLENTSVSIVDYQLLKAKVDSVGVL